MGAGMRKPPRFTMLKPRIATLQDSRVRPAPRPSRARSKSLYGQRWKFARAEFLRLHPLCECDECGAGSKRIRPANVVDHRIPHHGDERLFWDQSNWVAMATECHNAKTASQDGGFGNPRGA